MAESGHSSILHGLRMAKKCPSAWADMDGDDRCRTCRVCNFTVFDISTLGQSEVENIVKTGQAAGKQFYIRPDGRLINGNCRQVLDGMAKFAYASRSSGASFLFAVFVAIVVGYISYLVRGHH